MSNSYEKTVVVDKCNDCGFYRVWSGYPVCAHSMNPSKSTVDRMQGINKLEHKDYKNVPIPDSCPFINRAEIEEDLILIKIKSEGGTAPVNTMEVLVSEDGKYKQIGYIQELNIKADLENREAYINFGFPLEGTEEAKVSIRKNSSLLASRGCAVTLGNKGD